MNRLVVVALALVSTTVWAQSKPNPQDIYIDALTYGGTGCPAGTAAVDIAADGEAFTLIFDQYEAQVGPGIALVESRKNCQVNLTLHVPSGFTYAIASADYRGYAQLAKGATALQKASYYFQGQPLTGSLQTNFVGPLSQDWHVRHEADVASLVWAPCGVQRSLNINAQIRLDKGTSTGTSFMTIDSEDGAIVTVFNLVWAKCPTP